jgi:hypothetical protein
MPQNVPEIDEWTTPLTCPDNGDAVNGPTWIDAIKKIANRLNFVRQRAEGVAVGYTRMCPLVALGASSNFVWTNGGGPSNNAYGWEHNNTALAVIEFPLPVPKGDLVAKLVSVKIYFRPMGGHAGLPGNQPEFEVWRQPSDATIKQQIGTSQLLASGSVPAYEAPQSLTVTPAGGHVISNGDNYLCVFASETGANAVAGLTVTRLEIVTSPA